MKRVTVEELEGWAEEVVGDCAGSGGDMKDSMERLAHDIPQIERGRVWCLQCGRTQRVNGAECLRIGWPLCCGKTMTIDSPEERAAMQRSQR